MASGAGWRSRVVFNSIVGTHAAAGGPAIATAAGAGAGARSRRNHRAAGNASMIASA
jgi:hypothetical protein